MENEKDFKLSDFIKEPVVISLNNTTTFSEYTGNKDILLKKIKTFSRLITDKTLKDSFNEFFKDYI